MTFSNISLIRRATRQSLPRSKITRWILLIMRTLMVLGLIFLFARPLLHYGKQHAAGEENPYALVLILDASYSMRMMLNGQTVFARAQHIAADIVESLYTSDRASVIVFSNTLENPSPSLTADKHVLRTVIESTSARYRTTDIVSALGLAYQLLSQSAANRKGIILLSDGAQHGWHNGSRTLSDTLVYYDAGVQFILVDCSVRGDNVFIENVDTAMGVRRDTVRINSRINNPHEGDTISSTLSVFVDNKLAYNQGIVLKSRRTEIVSLSFPLNIQGVLPARCVLSPDSLIDDNEFYCYVNLPKKISVLCVDGDPAMGTVKGETFFLRSVLSENTGSDAITVTVITSDELNQTDISLYKTILLCNVDRIPEDVSKKIASFIERGGGVGIFPGNKITSYSYEALSTYMPVQWGDSTSGIVSIVSQTVPHQQRLLSEEGGEFEFDKIAVNRYFVFREKPSANVLYRLSSGHPLFVVSEEFAGRVLISSVPIDRDWSNIPAKPVYAPLMRGIIQFLAGGTYDQTIYTNIVGEKIKIRLPPKQIRVLDVVFNTTEHIGFQQIGRQLEIKPIEKPGHTQVYYQTQNNKDSLYIAVNIDPSTGESMPAKITSDTIQKLLPRTSVRWVKYSQTVLNEVLTLIRGKEIGRYIIAAIIILLCAETLVAHYMSKKNML